MSIKVALAGAGAFGIKHLDAIKLIDGVEVVSLIGRELDKTKEVAARYGIGHVSTDLADSLARKDVDAVILCTPTQMHAEQSIACLKAGKHVQVEIPLADSLQGAEAVAAAQRASGRVAMVGHTRRFNPSHQWVHNRITAKEFNIQQMDVQTYFFRRTNMNALGQPRSWTDHLLWHHAAHTVDLFAYQTGGEIVQANAVQGPIHPVLGIAMDMSIQLKSSSGAICTLSLSLQQRRAAGHLLPLHRRQRHLHRALRRSLQRQGREDRRLEGGGVDERHRTAGPRILRRDRGRPRAQCQRGQGVALLPRAARARAAVESMIRRRWLLAAAATAAMAVAQRTRPDAIPEPAGDADRAVRARRHCRHHCAYRGAGDGVDARPDHRRRQPPQRRQHRRQPGRGQGRSRRLHLLLMSNGNAVSASLFKKLPFDVVKDFAPISTLGFFELVICVARESRFNSLRELVAFGKANPGKLTLASIAVGSTQHLAAELFKSRTGVDAVVVPYKGSPAVLTALRAGEVDAGFEILGPTLPQITGGALRALAVTGRRRNAALPEVPTAIEQGVAGYEVESWNALAAPAGTPPAVIERLQRAAHDALAKPEVSQRLAALGVRAQGGTPAQLQDLLAGEIKRWREVIATARIEPQ